MTICSHQIDAAANVFKELDGDPISVKGFADKMFMNYFDSLALLRHLVELGHVVEIDTPQDSEANPNQTELF